MTCRPVSGDAQSARIRLTPARDWLGSAGEIFAAGLSLALTPDEVQNRCPADIRDRPGTDKAEDHQAGHLACYRAPARRHGWSSSPSREPAGVVAAVARWGFRCGESGREAGTAGACGPGRRERGRPAAVGIIHPDHLDLGPQGTPARQAGEEAQLHRGHDVRA
jgi:hypothetical protein